MYESLRLAQQESWQRGQPVTIESYVQRFPDLAGDADALAGFIAEEVSQREARGESPQLDEYLRRFPQCADQLIRQFSSRGRGLETNLPAASLGTPTGERYETIVSQPQGDLATAAQKGQAHWPQIPGFEIESELGRGGMGVVYRARQISADRLVALKVVRGDVLEAMPLTSQASTLERFRHEAQAAARLEHDNLVTVYEVGQAQGLYYYAMKYVQGRSLYDILRDGPLANRRAAQYLEPIARALHLAHEKGILHRDLKPHNILIDERSDRPLLADFGLAKFVERQQDLTLAGEVMGTPSYMSPEQARDPAHVKGAADVYSLGATLYHLITGRPPFLAASLAETIRQICEVEPVPPWVLNPDVDRDLETICLKCLQKEPARRYESAQALADDLSRYLEGRPIVARPVGTVERVWRWCRRNPRLAGMIATAATFALVAVVAIVVGYVQTKAALAQSEARLQRAVTVVEDMFTRVSENELLNTPGFQPLRKELLEGALKHYQYFLAESGGNPAIKDEVAASQYRVGYITWLIGAPDAALHHLLLAREAQEELLVVRPDDRSRLKALADTLNALGSVYAVTDSPNKAIESYEQAARIRGKLVDLEPKDENLNRLLANTWMNLGIAQRAQGQMDKAHSQLVKAQELRQRLLSDNPKFDKARSDFAMGSYELGRLEVARKQDEKAIQHFREAIGQFEQVLAGDKYSLPNQYHLSICYRSLAALFERQQDIESALNNYEKATPWVERVAIGNPQVLKYQQELIVLAIKKGMLYEEQSALPSARSAWTQALTTAQDLVESDPADPMHRRDVATSLSALGVIELLSGDRAQAAKRLAEARDMLQALIKDLPQDENLQRQLDDTLANLALCIESEKRD